MGDVHARHVAIDPFQSTRFADCALQFLEDAVEIAKLRPAIRPGGLSLGDRACLALARRYGARVLTADGTWTRFDIGVRVQAIR